MQAVRCQGAVRLRAAPERTGITHNRTKCAAMAWPTPACKGSVNSVKIADERCFPLLRWGVDSPMFSASVQQVLCRTLHSRHGHRCFSVAQTLAKAWPCVQRGMCPNAGSGRFWFLAPPDLGVDWKLPQDSQERTKRMTRVFYRQVLKQGSGTLFQV